MTTWTELYEQILVVGVTPEIAREARRMISELPPREPLPTDRAAQVDVLAAIRKRLVGHESHGNTSARHWIAKYDVVVVEGLTDDNGVPTQCPDDVCRAWQEMNLAIPRKKYNTKKVTKTRSKGQCTLHWVATTDGHWCTRHDKRVGKP